MYVGQKPPDLLSQEARANRIISEFKAGPKSGFTGTVPIDYSVELNPRFSVIVGNKGQGKSALLDLIALGGNSTRTADFAFLNSKRFLRSTNHDADDIAVTLTWATGLKRTVEIRHGYSAAEVEEVEYLPQSLIEKVCSSDPNSATGQEFEAELRRVLFTHIPIEDREESNSFDEILERGLRAVDPQLRSRRAKLRTDVEAYLSLLAERAGADLSALRSREAQLITSLETATEERARAALALEQSAMSGDPETLRLREEYEVGRTAFLAAGQSLTEARTEAAHYAANVRALDGLAGRLEAIVDAATSINDEFAEIIVAEAEAESSQLISVSIDMAMVEALRSAWVERRVVLDARIALIGDEQTAIIASLADIQRRLEIGDADREQKRAHLEAIQQRIDSIIGSPAEPQTLRGVRALISRAEELPFLIDRAETEVLSGVANVHSLIVDRLTVYRGLYRPAAEFVQHNPLAAQVGFEFAANLIFAPLWESLFEGLDARRNAGLISYLETVQSTVEPNNPDSVVATIQGILLRLRHDGGNANGRERDPAAATKKATSVADYVHRLASLRWIDTQLTITKDGQLLEQLSPGQRGLILLLFYLVVDNSQMPLLLDQPEENLDNEAIKTSLVPAIQFACTRRQIILVTHNANLAIVGDADQILHTTIDADRRFHIAAGGLAEFELGETSIDILEGARPAFANRQAKYWRVVVDS